MYNVNGSLKTIKIFLKNELESDKIGKYFTCDKIMILKEQETLTKVTVIRNNYLVGLRFTYSNREEQIFNGKDLE